MIRLFIEAFFLLKKTNGIDIIGIDEKLKEGVFLLKINSLTKEFAEIVAIKNISFEVKKGEVFGLLGENGAGKTTTLRTIATMLKPTSGTVEVCGYKVNENPQKVRENIGILFGGETGLYDRLTVYENIKYFGELNDMSKDEINKQFNKLIKVFNMEDFKDRKASKLSKGMKQKVAFARAVIHNPNVMLFDEPSSGLDVNSTRSVHEFINICRRDKKAIVFSSHTMSEVIKLCDKIGIINKGMIMELGTIDEIQNKYGLELEEAFVKIVGGDK